MTKTLKIFNGENVVATRRTNTDVYPALDLVMQFRDIGFADAINADDRRVFIPWHAISRIVVVDGQ